MTVNVVENIESIRVEVEGNSQVKQSVTILLSELVRNIRQAVQESPQTVSKLANELEHKTDELSEAVAKGTAADDEEED